MSGRAGTNVEQIRPCLIGGFRCKNAPSGLVDHFAPVSVAASGGVLSVDMVRLRLVLRSASDGESLAARESLLPTTDDTGYRSYTSSPVPGRFRLLSTYPMGDSSVTLGLGLVDKMGRVDWQQGMAEFNPNKVCAFVAQPTFGLWLGKVSKWVKRAELVRWDLAYDVPVMRDGLRLEKDRRRYEFVQGATLTEYLGARNSEGRVKLYDKADEQGLQGVALTRLELTCGGSWGVDEVVGAWPVVYGVRPQPSLPLDGLSNTNMLLAGLLAERVRSGHSVEPEIKSLNKRTRAKVRAALESADVMPRPADGEFSRVRAVAQKWESLDVRKVLRLAYASVRA